jgi:hypothetical protein
MFYADRKSSPAGLTIHLFGAMDERADYFSVIGTPPMEVTFNTRGVKKVNSTGIGNWLKFAKGMNDGGVKISYSECSPAFVAALTYACSPRYGGKAESVFAPFRCPRCKTNEDKLIKTPDIFAIKPQLASQKCTNCQGPLTFDETTEKFFAFLMTP